MKKSDIIPFIAALFTGNFLFNLANKFILKDSDNLGYTILIIFVVLLLTAIIFEAGKYYQNKRSIKE